MHSDEDCIDRTLNGDPSAFGELVVRYQDRLFTTVVHLLGSQEDARDVVQDAFVQAFVKLDSFRRDAAFYTWLYRIAINLAIGLRRKTRPVRSLDQMRECGTEPSGSNGAWLERLTSTEARNIHADKARPGDGAAFMHAVRRERAVVVHAAVRSLHDEHRHVLVLREFDGYSYEEISQLLDVPIGTVRSRLHRARAQLRELLLPMMADPR